LDKERKIWRGVQEIASDLSQVKAPLHYAYVKINMLEKGD